MLKIGKLRSIIKEESENTDSNKLKGFKGSPMNVSNFSPEFKRKITHKFQKQ